MLSPIVVGLYALGAFLALIVLNVTRQLLFRNKNEPPTVFHWIPWLGSTVTYGMDPYKFFFTNREKVHSTSIIPEPI
jgi:sterol 14-demethylase